jgi:hypothetical protein
MVVVICESVAEQHREEDMREVARRMNEWSTGKPAAPRPDPEWRHYWSTWASD